MKLFSQKGRPLSRAQAKNAAFLNQLATPGLGSLLCRRWVAGTGQLLLALAGFGLVLVWFGGEMMDYLGQISGRSPQHASIWMLELGVALFAASWVWSAITSFSLLREASSSSQHSLENFAAPPVQKLDGAKIVLALMSVPEWKQNGDTISRTFQFKDFPAAIQFVTAVAALAEEAWHHPDIDIRWNKVTLTLSTHDAGGLTEKDFDLARKFDRLSTR